MAAALLNAKAGWERPLGTAGQGQELGKKMEPQRREKVIPTVTRARSAGCL